MFGAKQFGSGYYTCTKATAKLKSQVRPTKTQSDNIPGSFQSWAMMFWGTLYYLKYQNKRPEYLKQWWNVVNWNEINKRFGNVKSLAGNYYWNIDNDFTCGCFIDFRTMQRLSNYHGIMDIKKNQRNT